jgi:hypothetical protein
MGLGDFANRIEKATLSVSGTPGPCTTLPNISMRRPLQKERPSLATWEAKPRPRSTLPPLFPSSEMNILLYIELITPSIWSEALLLLLMDWIYIRYRSFELVLVSNKLVKFGWTP